MPLYEPCRNHQPGYICDECSPPSTRDQDLEAGLIWIDGNTISAWELREMGFAVPEEIPDVATTPRAGLGYELVSTEADKEKRELRATIRLTGASFRWIEYKHEWGADDDE